MKISKERVVYAAVLGCGLVLLILDRAIFAPAGADAAPTDDYSVQKSDDDAALIAMPETDATGTPSLATRLSADSPDWEQNLRNGFIVSVEWIPPPPPPEQAATTPEEDLAAAFAGAHSVKAIQGSRSRVPGGFVDGKFIKIGDTLEGWTLVEVTDNSVVFARDSLRAELLLSQPHVAGTVGVKGEGDPPPPAMDPGKP